jgi:hypothetical protein
VQACRCINCQLARWTDQVIAARVTIEGIRDMALKIKLPTELVGLKSHLIRAEGQEKAIAKLGEGYVEVQGRIDELVDAHSEHLGALKHYEGELRRKIEGMVGSNGDPTDGQDGQNSGSETGQIISSETPK